MAKLKLFDHITFSLQKQIYLESHMYYNGYKTWFDSALLAFGEYAAEETIVIII